MNEKTNSRTKALGLNIINLIDKLPNKPSGWVIGKQILRSATSVGASYRAAFRAESNADFINKLKIVEEEADETIFWLEVIEEANLLTPEGVSQLKVEANEILSIIVCSIKSARKNES